MYQVLCIPYMWFTATSWGRLCYIPHCLDEAAEAQWGRISRLVNVGAGIWTLNCSKELPVNACLWPSIQGLPRLAAHSSHVSSHLPSTSHQCQVGRRLSKGVSFQPHRTLQGMSCLHPVLEVRLPQELESPPWATKASVIISHLLNAIYWPVLRSQM